MSDWALITEGGFSEELGSIEASTGTTLITTPGTANTKSAYSSIGTTNQDWDGFWWGVFNRSAASNDHLIDLAIGAASSEVVILPNFIGSGAGDPAFYNYIYIPIPIPSGTALSARAQANSASQSVGCHVIGVAHGFVLPGSLGRCTAYGPDTSDSGGVDIDAGAGSNTKGSWTQITSSTTYDHKALLLLIGNGNSTSRTAQRFLIDVGIGGAGSEQIVAKDIFVRTTASGSHVEKPLPGNFGVFAQEVPAGTRIAVRMQCSSASSTDRHVDVAVYGFN